MELEAGIESMGVKMESRGKLGNDKMLKFVGPRKSVRWREKVCGPRDILKLPFSIPYFNSLSQFMPNKQAPGYIEITIF